MGFVTYAAGAKPAENYMGDFSKKDLTKEYTYDELWEKVFNSEDSSLPRPLTKAHRIIVVDADAIVYRISAACEKRSVEAVIEGKKLKFKTKTKLKEHCNSIGVDFTTVDFEEKVKIEPVENAYHTLKKTVAKIYRELNATHVIFFLGGSYNFRTDLKLPSKYKSNRKTTRRPEHLQACREYLNKNYDTYLVSGIEADDCVQGITEYIVNRKRAYACAYQLDKDFETSLTKNRYYHLGRDEIVELSGGLGSLKLSKNTVKGEGLMWLCFQIFLGDPSDGYSPKKFFSRIYGEKSYFKDFKDCRTEKELLLLWVEKWRELVGEEVEYIAWDGTPMKKSWLELANLYMQCAYMRHSPEDDTTFKSLLYRYGIDVSDSGDLKCFDAPEVEKPDLDFEDEMQDSTLEIKEEWEW